MTVTGSSDNHINMYGVWHITYWVLKTLLLLCKSADSYIKVMRVYFKQASLVFWVFLNWTILAQNEDTTVYICWTICLECFSFPSSHNSNCSPGLILTLQISAWVSTPSRDMLSLLARICVTLRTLGSPSTCSMHIHHCLLPCLHLWDSASATQGSWSRHSILGG